MNEMSIKTVAVHFKINVSGIFIAPAHNRTPRYNHNVAPKKPQERYFSFCKYEMSLIIGTFYDKINVIMMSFYDKIMSLFLSFYDKDNLMLF